MSWFRVDDTLWCHRKARKAGLEALGFWAVCGSYASGAACADNGVLSLDDLDTLAGLHKIKHWRRLADKLVEAGLWETIGDDHAFHDWDDYRPGGDAELARRRSRDADRKRKARESRDASKEMSADGPRTEVGHVLGQSADARPHPPVPSIPVPSRPDPPNPHPVVDDPAGMVSGVWLAAVAKASGKPQSRLSIRDVKTLHAVCEAHAPEKRGQALLDWVASLAAEFAVHATAEGLNFGGFGVDRVRKWIDAGKPKKLSEAGKNGRVVQTDEPDLSIPQ